MEKNIKMSLDAARQMYKEGNETTNKWLLENFTKEELEPKKGFTWEDSYGGVGFYVMGNSSISNWSGGIICGQHKNVFLTEKHAKSALAFAQLSHIVNKYNEGKELEHCGDMVYDQHKDFITKTEYYDVYYYVTKYDGKNLGINSFRFNFMNLYFKRREDAKTSMEVNRQLWLDYWMID